MREWFQQELPYGMVDFGPTPKKRNAAHTLEYLRAWTDVFDVIDTFVKGFDDSILRLPRGEFDSGLLAGRGNDEVSAFVSFQIVLRKVGIILGLSIFDLSYEVPVRRSRGSPSQQAVSLVASPSERADIVATVDGKLVLVIEMKRPRLFRRSIDSDIPSLLRLQEPEHGHRRRQPTTEEDVIFAIVQQLFVNMCWMNLGLYTSIIL